LLVEIGGNVILKILTLAVIGDTFDILSQEEKALRRSVKAYRDNLRWQGYVVWEYGDCRCSRSLYGCRREDIVIAHFRVSVH
jgi:hypothetical protein